MRRSTLTCVGALSLIALISAASACATSPDDGLGETVAEAKTTEPEEAGAKLPPPSASAPATDSGTTPPADAAKPDTGSTSSSSSSSGSSGSSGSSTSSSSSGGVGPACNISDPVKLLVYQYEVSQQSSPVPCPCIATQCCYLGVTCIKP